jgi:hypothetical protein
MPYTHKDYFLLGHALMIARHLDIINERKGRAIGEELGVVATSIAEVQALAADFGAVWAACDRGAGPMPVYLIKRVQLAVLAAGASTPICSNCSDLGVVVKDGVARVLAVGEKCPACQTALTKAAIPWNFTTSQDWAKFSTNWRSSHGLAHFFESFGQVHMRRFLATNQDQELVGLLMVMPGNSSTEIDFATALADKCVRRGIANAGHKEFYMNLATFAPNHAGDIIAVAKLVGVRISKADFKD